MDMISAVVIFTLAPILLLSFLFQNKPGSTFGPKVCTRCSVELRAGIALAGSKFGFVLTPAGIVFTTARDVRTSEYSDGDNTNQHGDNLVTIVNSWRID